MEPMAPLSCHQPPSLWSVRMVSLRCSSLRNSGSFWFVVWYGNKPRSIHRLLLQSETTLQPLLNFGYFLLLPKMEGLNLSTNLQLKIISWKSITSYSYKTMQNNIHLKRITRLTFHKHVLMQRFYWVGWYMYEGNLLHYADKSACHFKSFAILLICVAYLIYLAMSCFFWFCRIVST